VTNLPTTRGVAHADVLRKQFAPNASNEDLAYFAQVAKHLDVDPWAGHLALIPKGGVYKPTLTVMGRRFIAQRTGRWRGIYGPEYCGPRRFDEHGAKLPLEWDEVWDDDDTPPYAARVLIYTTDFIKPVNGTTKWSEFVQTFTTKQGELKTMDTWLKMPSHMLGKCAESLALRRGFPEVQAAVAYVGDDDEAAIVADAEAESYIPPAAQVSPGSDQSGDRSAVPEPAQQQQGISATPQRSGRRATTDGRRRYPESSDRETQRRYTRSSPYDDDMPESVRDNDPENTRPWREP